MKNSFTQVIGNEPVSIRSTNDSEFVFELPRENENSIFHTITELTFPHYKQTVEAEVSHSEKINQSNAMIYIQKCNTTVIIEYSEQLT